MINDQERQDMIEFMQREVKRREILLREAEKNWNQYLLVSGASLEGSRAKKKLDHYKAYKDRAFAILAGLRGNLPDNLKQQYEKEKKRKLDPDYETYLELKSKFD